MQKVFIFLFYDQEIKFLASSALTLFDGGYIEIQINGAHPFVLMNDFSFIKTPFTS